MHRSGFSEISPVPCREFRKRSSAVRSNIFIAPTRLMVKVLRKHSDWMLRPPPRSRPEAFEAKKMLSRVRSKRARLLRRDLKGLEPDFLKGRVSNQHLRKRNANPNCSKWRCILRGWVIGEI